LRFFFTAPHPSPTEVSSMPPPLASFPPHFVASIMDSPSLSVLTLIVLLSNRTTLCPPPSVYGVHLEMALPRFSPFLLCVLTGHSLSAHGSKEVLDPLPIWRPKPPQISLGASPGFAEVFLSPPPPPLPNNLIRPVSSRSVTPPFLFSATLSNPYNILHLSFRRSCQPGKPGWRKPLASLSPFYVCFSTFFSLLLQCSPLLEPAFPMSFEFCCLWSSLFSPQSAVGFPSPTNIFANGCSRTFWLRTGLMFSPFECLLCPLTFFPLDSPPR